MKPVFVIDKAIELVNRRDGVFSDFCPGTVGHEVVEESPCANLEFGRGPVSMKVA